MSDFKRDEQIAEKKFDSKVKRSVRDKEKRIKKFRQEASRLSAMANKRLARLEKSGMTDSPAYRKWLDEGGEKFGVRGKDFNEVQQEVARLRKFINSQTSTIRGVNKTLKDMAKNTGIKYKNLEELRKHSGTFFQLASKIEQYLRTVEDMASAIGYQKIWTAINQYVKETQIDLSQSEDDIEDMTHKIIQAMDIYNETDIIHVQHGSTAITGWYHLK